MGLERLSAFLPYDTFEIETPYTLEEVQECIQALIEQRTPFATNISAKDVLRVPLFQGSPVPFAGKVEGTRFHIIPQLGQRNTPRLHFYGTTAPTPYGSTVHVKIRLPLILIIFWVILGIPLLLSLPSLLYGQFAYFGPLGGAAVVLYFMTMFTYIGQAPVAKQELLRVLVPQTEKAVKQA